MDYEPETEPTDEEWKSAYRNGSGMIRMDQLDDPDEDLSPDEREEIERAMY